MEQEAKPMEQEAKPMEQDANAMEIADTSDGARALVPVKMDNIDNDMARALRDFCRINQHPAPVIQTIGQSVYFGQREYTVKCEVADFRGIATAYDEEQAKSNAARQVLNIMKRYPSTARPKTTRQRSTPGKVIYFTESDRRPTSTRFREEFLNDRFAYFSTYYDHLKQDALRILYSPEYTTNYLRAMHCFRALKLTPARSLAESDPFSRKRPMIMLEVDCDFDCLFMNYEERIFDDVVEYFKGVLK